MLEIKSATELTHLHIRLRGELTSATAPQLDTALAVLLAGPAKPWVLDLEELSFSSSAGLRVFLSYAKKVPNAGGRLVFCAVQPTVLEVLEMSGFTRILSLVSNADAARRLFAAS